MPSTPSAEDIRETVTRMLREDIGDGNPGAALIDSDMRAQAWLLCHEGAVLAGQPWFDEVFRQLAPDARLEWSAADGDAIHADQRLCLVSGPALALVTGERAALNLVQTLSATATACRRFADRIKGTRARIVDTRRTLPALRAAQKYAVRCGGCDNTRHGLYDGILIDSRHACIAGSITAAVTNVRNLYPQMPVEIAVETAAEVDEALATRPDFLLLRNFPSHLMARAVHKAEHHRRMNLGDVKVTACGDIDLTNVRTVADTGVDYIRVREITQNVSAVNLSMQFEFGA